MKTTITLIFDLGRNFFFFFPSSVVLSPGSIVAFLVPVARSDCVFCFRKWQLVPLSGEDCAIGVAESRCFEPGIPSDSSLAIVELIFSWLAGVFRKPLESPKPFFVLSNYITNNNQNEDFTKLSVDKTLQILWLGSGGTIKKGGLLPANPMYLRKNSRHFRFGWTALFLIPAYSIY